MANILYVTYGDPERASSGNEQRTHLVYEALKKLGRVYTIELVEHGVGRVRDDYCRCLLEQPSRGRKLVNLLAHHTYLRLTGSHVEGYRPFSLRLDVAGCFPGVRFDFVVKRYLSHLGAVHLWNIAPLYVDIDDHPLQQFETLVRPKVGWRRLYMAPLQRLYLRLISRHVRGGWIANPAQASWSRFQTPVRPLLNLPCLPPSGYDAAAPRADYIFSIGLMAYSANAAGVDWFVREIWPSVRAAFPRLSYWICGKGVPPECAARWSAVEGVCVKGFVEDKEALYAGALASVVPIFQGGGTCLKTLESLAYSRACLSTPFGARGFPEEDLASGACGIRLFETADDMVAHLRRLATDAAARTRLEAAGRAWVAAHCSAEEFDRQVARVCGGVSI